MRRAIGLLRQRCPRCMEGRVFSGLLRMNEECPVCGVRFGRDEGYFTGAMYFSYTLAFLVVIPVWLVMLFTGQPVWAIIAAPSLVLVLVTPILWRYSRVVWMYFDRAFDPDAPREERRAA